MNSEVQPSLLMMTATINPQPGAAGLDRTDPALRMKDYCEALDFYLSKKSRLIDRIVFVENSHSDLSPLQRLAENNRGSKQVEFVSFYGLDYPPEYIRGYGEFKLLDYAFHNSRLLTQFCTFPENTELAVIEQGVVSADFSAPTSERLIRARRGSPR